MFGFFRKNKTDKFMRDMMSAYAEGMQRSKVNQAMGSLDIQLDLEKDNAQFCIQNTIHLTRHILKQYGTDLKKINEDDIFTLGVFIFVISNHFSRIIGASFELVSSVSLTLFVDDLTANFKMAEYVQPVGELYNNSNNIVDAIGNTLVKWVDEPTHENFDLLVSLYKLCRSHIETN